MTPRPFVPKPKKVKAAVSPCVGCPYEMRVCKIEPVIPSAPRLAVVGDAPDEGSEFTRTPLSGPAEDLLRDALAAAGYAWEQVAVFNLTRCRAEEDDLDGAPHLSAEKRCRKYLVPDLALERVSGIPLLLLGERALHRFWKEEGEKGRKPTVGAYRGLWFEAKGIVTDRKAFVARHPRDILGARSLILEGRRAEFFEDLRRMAVSLNGDDPLARIERQVFSSPVEATDFLAWLAEHPGPWAFDIEAFDAVEFPSRKFVSTDPCHPDYRVRGIAFAWSGTAGAWVDLKDWNEGERKQLARFLLGPAFASPAEKWAFSGHYDEEGLVYTGFIPYLSNRAGDGMLAMVALGDGTHDSLRLEKAVVDVLKRPSYWNGQDKGKMRDIPLAAVADGAIGDACCTFELCADLHDRIRREDYLLWGN